MGQVVLHTPVRQVGNSLAVFIPAPQARDMGLRVGDTVRVELDLDLPNMLGRWPALGSFSPADKRELWPED